MSNSVTYFLCIFNPFSFCTNCKTNDLVSRKVKDINVRNTSRKKEIKQLHENLCFLKELQKVIIDFLKTSSCEYIALINAHGFWKSHAISANWMNYDLAPDCHTCCLIAWIRPAIKYDFWQNFLKWLAVIMATSNHLSTIHLLF